VTDMIDSPFNYADLKGFSQACGRYIAEALWSVMADEVAA
jgi:hypothetical protein